MIWSRKPQKIVTKFRTPEDAFGERTQFPKPTLAYIKKYWLDDDEYNGFWKEKQETIFSSNIDYPDGVFMDLFTSTKLVGGVLFTEDEFNCLKKLMLYAGDDYFVICEDIDYSNRILDAPPVRLKFPSNIQWTEMQGEENVITYEVFKQPLYDLFVFGDSCKWGYYFGGDRDYRDGGVGEIFSIWGTRDLCTKVFEEIFHNMISEYNPESWDFEAGRAVSMLP